MLLQKSHRTCPGQFGRRFVVTWRGVVVKPVIHAGVDMGRERFLVGSPLVVTYLIDWIIVPQRPL